MDRSPIPDPHYTYGDYVLWKGDERWELIDGAPHLMSPAPTRRHQEYVTELAHQIRNQLPVDGPCRAYASPFDVRFPKGDEPDAEVDTVLQPDLLVVCDPAKLDDAGCRGAPDWVIEIASPATSIRDRVQKREVYERAGVDEYWLIDPADRTLSIWQGGEERTTTANGKVQATAVAITIDFAQIRD